MRFQALTWSVKGLVIICLGEIITTHRRDNITGKSRDTRSYECRNWTIVRIYIPLATNLVCPCPSRLAKARYFLILLVFCITDDA